MWAWPRNREDRRNSGGDAEDFRPGGRGCASLSSFDSRPRERMGEAPRFEGQKARIDVRAPSLHAHRGDNEVAEGDGLALESALNSSWRRCGRAFSGCWSRLTAGAPARPIRVGIERACMDQASRDWSGKRRPIRRYGPGWCSRSGGAPQKARRPGRRNGQPNPTARSAGAGSGTDALRDSQHGQEVSTPHSPATVIVANPIVSSLNSLRQLQR